MSNEKERVTHFRGVLAPQSTSCCRKRHAILLHGSTRPGLCSCSEISQIEEVLNKYEWYGTILFKLSPLEWQEAQTESLKAGDAQEKQSSDSKGKRPGGSSFSRRSGPELAFNKLILYGARD